VAIVPGAFPRALFILAPLNCCARSIFPSQGYAAKVAVPGAPVMDFVFTVCDHAAGEVCPIWPGQPITAHWGVPDPAAAEGNAGERMQAFRDAFGMLERRIKIFVALAVASLDRITLAREVKAIGRQPHPETTP
jgi:arsenate reductase (thioredoxin)